MEAGEAMLRQLIGQIQELCGSPSLDRNQRCYMLNLEYNVLEDSLSDLVAERKPGAPKLLDSDKSPPAKKSRGEKVCENSIAASSSTEVMDEQIWKDFPEDLIEAVIARLPIATFFQFRSVCRKWNSLLTSPSFSEQCADVPRVNPWFFTNHRHVFTGAIYDPSLKKWHHPVFQFLPVRMATLPVASAGGLICLWDVNQLNFYVCNPLTLSFKGIPPCSDRGLAPAAVGMVLNGRTTSSGYKLIWLDCNGDHQVYDSLQNTWTCPGVVPPSIKHQLSLDLRSQTVSIGSTLYFMCANPDSVVSYDAVSGAWKRFVIPSPKHLTDRTLAECGGQLLLVGLLSNNAATCVYVWELQKMTLLWKEVDRMPNIWCLEFYGKHVTMTCLGNRGLLMLSLRSKRMNRLVTFDVSKRDWQRVPDCSFHHEKMRFWDSIGTAFFPCPTALP
ncbi:F-box only protein 6-like isoform X1 [Dioscorea cayenensis subsp. rotundata]|uniref:F-box only protein 6-like isoform X1 n=2 Tax=Dioscorea cayennensis subsp. rotundata TaxID=55577 RepID=A0AB40BES7_DIOCR|nr:F-box only protein 6-like isoform X1 [Dioscorea cayenensis subsp. rotundata]